MSSVIRTKQKNVSKNIDFWQSYGRSFLHGSKSANLLVKGRCQLRQNDDYKGIFHA